MWQEVTVIAQHASSYAIFCALQIFYLSLILMFKCHIKRCYETRDQAKKKLKKPVLLSPFLHKIAMILIFPYAYNTLHLLAGRFSQGTYLLGTLYFSRFAIYNCLNIVSRAKVFH